MQSSFGANPFHGQGEVQQPMGTRPGRRLTSFLGHAVSMHRPMGLRRSLGWALRRGSLAPSPLRLASTAAGDVDAKELANGEGGAGPTLELKESDKLPAHDGVTSGVLDNGLRYCIFPNKKPAGRFYVNLEVHAGSADEDEHERGLAHFLEHAVFLGTQRFPTQQAMKALLRRLGMAYNADANAFTDFRSTVYTFSAPVTGRAEKVESNAALFGAGGVVATAPAEALPAEEEQEEGVSALDEDDNADNTVLVLELLEEMMFKARLDDADIDLERGAVLSELKDRDTISQRIAMQYYRFHHSDTVLPARFPIGLERLVSQFKAADFRAFYSRHYYPANMCLYLTGDINAEDMEDKIRRVFARQPAGPRDGSTGKALGAHDASSPIADWPRRGLPILHSTFLQGEALAAHEARLAHMQSDETIEGTSGARAMATLAKDNADNDASYLAVAHPLLTEFSASLCAKAAESSTKTVGDLRESLIDSVIGMVLDFRVNELRLQSKDPIFNSISWSLSSTPREGCSTNSFSVSSRPKKWREALALALGEAARLREHGVTEGELSQALTTLINYFATQAVMKDSLESSTWMRRVMDAVNNGDQMMRADQKLDILRTLAAGLSVQEVCVRARELFEPFYALAEQGAGGGELVRGQFPTAKAFVSRPSAEVSDANPELSMKEYTKEEFFKVMKTAVQEPEAPALLSMPDSLVDPAVVEALVAKAQPSIRDRHEEDIGPDEGKLVRFTLSNGVRVAYRRNSARPQEFRVRVSAVGGRALETREQHGHAVAGAALWINGGAGEHPAEVVSRFASMHQLSYDCSCGAETLSFDLLVHTTVDQAIERAMSVLWLYLAHPLMDSRALDRFKTRIQRSEQSLPKSVERTTTLELVRCLFTEESQWRLAELPYHVAEKIEIDQVKSLLARQLVPSNLEVAISGDFDPAELEAGLVRYCGILGVDDDARASAAPAWHGREDEVFRLHYGAGSRVGSAAHITDDTERAYVLMAFPTVNRWGRLVASAPGGVELDLVGGKSLKLVPSTISAGEGGSYCADMHVSRCMSVANDIISNRLFEEVREKRGLVYSVGFSWRPYRLLSGGYCSISFLPKMDQVAQSVAQVKAVLRDLLDNGFSEDEFQGSKGPLVTKVRETEKQNVFWVQLMEDLGNDASPKSVDCIRQVADHYDTLTKEMVLEVMRATMSHCTDNLSIATGSAGPEAPETPLL